MSRSRAWRITQFGRGYNESTTTTDWRDVEDAFDEFLTGGSEVGDKRIVERVSPDSSTSQVYNEPRDDDDAWRVMGWPFAT